MLPCTSAFRSQGLLKFRQFKKVAEKDHLKKKKTNSPVFRKPWETRSMNSEAEVEKVADLF